MFFSSSSVGSVVLDKFNPLRTILGTLLEENHRYSVTKESNQTLTPTLTLAVELGIMILGIIVLDRKKKKSNPFTYNLQKKIYKHTNNNTVSKN
jgi:hypothetical protein